MKSSLNSKIIEQLKTRSVLKHGVFDTTYKVFGELREVLANLPEQYNTSLEGVDERVRLSYEEVGNFVSKLRVAGDVLVFCMHSNAFMFDRDHKVWEQEYVKENGARCYTGVINIFNFLYDSFRYNRSDDMGYLVARVFINRERSFFVEGKRQRAMGVASFGKEPISKESLLRVVETSILYSLEFDLLAPPYENVSVITVAQLNEEILKSRMRTGKRLGFNFKADDVKG